MNLEALNVSLVRTSAEKVRVVLAAVPTGCAVLSMPASYPTDGTPVVDVASGATWWVYELELGPVPVGGITANARKDLETALFAAKDQDKLRARFLRSGIAHGLLALFRLLGEP